MEMLLAPQTMVPTIEALRLQGAENHPGLSSQAEDDESDPLSRRSHSVSSRCPLNDVKVRMIFRTPGDVMGAVLFNVLRQTKWNVNSIYHM